jgi:hypothetical protein
MTTAELLALRGGLADRRRALLDRLVSDGADVLEPAFIRMLADTHTAVAAADAELIEMEGDVE